MRRAVHAVVAVTLAMLALPGAARAGEVRSGGAAAERRAAEGAARWHARRGLYFERNWGIDVVAVRRVASGFMLRFDYRVVDPARAAPLSDHKLRPYVIDEATHAALAVPAMENVGELRQVATPVAQRTYFMIFGNPGGLVKRGGKVTLVMGGLRMEGLVVQ